MWLQLRVEEAAAAKQAALNRGQFLWLFASCTLNPAPRALYKGQNPLCLETQITTNLSLSSHAMQHFLSTTACSRATTSSSADPPMSFFGPSLQGGADSDSDRETWSWEEVAHSFLKHRMTHRRCNLELKPFIFAPTASPVCYSESARVCRQNTSAALNTVVFRASAGCTCEWKFSGGRV